MKNRNKAVYYRLIWKKGLVILPRFLVTLVITAIVLVLAAFLVFGLVQQERSLNLKVPVAVVVPDRDLETTMAISMVAEMDAIKNYCDLQFLTDKRAHAALERGDVMAAVYLTENLLGDVSSGTNTPVVIQLASGSGLGVQRFRDIINIGLSLVQAGQAGMYALDEMMELHPVTENARSIRNDVIDDYFLVLLNRANTWDTTLLSPFGDIAIAGFYSITAALGITCLLFGSCFAALYDKKERAVDICLSRLGIGAVTRSLSRLAVMTFVNWCLMTIILIPALILTKSAQITPGLILKLLPGLLPTAFAISAFTHLVYAFAVGESGSLFFLICSVLVFVLGGGLFPAAYLPRFLYHFARVLPVYIWQKYLSELVWGQAGLLSLAGVTLYGLAMAAAGGIGLKIHERD